MRKLVAATLGNVVLPHRIPFEGSFADPIPKNNLKSRQNFLTASFTHFQNRNEKVTIEG